jgi:pimeloyl-ACP methyl ester carboxylesterase
MRFETDDIGLNVIIEGPGDGVPVVFVHGVASSLRTYDWLPRELAAERRIIRVDLRGHGESDHAPGSYVIDRYGRDVAAVVRDLAGRPAVLVGHSLGGVAAWWVAQRHPELVLAAFLEDPPLYMGEPAEHARNAIAKVFPLVRDRAVAWQREGLYVARAAQRVGAAPAGAVATVRMRDVVLEDALLSLAYGHLHMDPEVLTGAADGTTLAGTDTSGRVDAPTVILAADEALMPAFSPAHEQRLAQTHPDVEVVRVARAGHLIHDGRASRDTYVKHLAAFLDTPRRR